MKAKFGSKTFASLNVRNYRIFAAGALISNIGNWAGSVTQDWLVLVILTNKSSMALGIVSGLQFLPIALLVPISGTVIDRYKKHKILMCTQTLLFLNSLILYILVAIGVARLWHVFVLAAVQGIIIAFDNPARQAFASEIVDTKLLTNAVSLNSASFNGARLIGPAVAGVSIAMWGVSPTLLVNSISFFVFLIALSRMNTYEMHPAPRVKGKGAAIEGLRYIKNRPDLVLIMCVVFVLGTFGLNFQISNALMATKVFHKGAEIFGLLSSVMAVGTLTGAMLSARRARPRLRILLGSLGMFSVFCLLAVLSPNIIFYCGCLTLIGLFSMLVIVTSNAAVQLSIDPKVRGRVLAVFSAVLMGGTPIGAPIVGWIGQVLGARWTILFGGISCLVMFISAAAYFVFHKKMRVRFQMGWPPQAVIESIAETEAITDEKGKTN